MDHISSLYVLGMACVDETYIYISTAPLDNVIMSSEKQPIRLRQPLTSCGEMHLLPCSVQMERVGGGPARVDSYFAPLVREENEVTAGDMKGNHSNL